MGVRAKHFSSDLLPPKQDFTWTTLRRTIADHLHFRRPRGEEEWRYNLLQRISYLAVVFGLIPFMFLTGLAMSPKVTSVFPSTLQKGERSISAIHLKTIFRCVAVSQAQIMQNCGYCQQLGIPSTKYPTQF